MSIAPVTKDDFAVTDEGQPQTIVSFSHEEISKTARAALGHLRPGDSVSIMVFAKTTAVHQDFSDNPAETARQIGSAVHDHDVGVTTQINSAVMDAAHHMEAHGDPGPVQAGVSRAGCGEGCFPAY